MRPPERGAHVPTMARDIMSREVATATASTSIDDLCEIFQTRNIKGVPVVDAAGQLSAIGELSSRRGAVDPSYRCEVSCIDWYGNTRALYIGARVFALSGTELIEGAVSSGRISERVRLNLSAAPPRVISSR